MPQSAIQVHFSEGNILVLNLCLSLIMFGVSLGLTVTDFKRILQRPKAAITGLITQYFILPAIILAFCIAFKPEYGLSIGVMLVICSPGGNVSNLLTKVAKGDVALSVAITSISTVLAAFAIPIMFNNYSQFLPKDQEVAIQSLSIVEMAKTVLLLTAFPLALGMLVTRYLPALSRKLEGPMKTISLLIFFTFIVFAFIKNKEPFMTHLGKVFWLVLAVNALSFFVGYIVTRLAGGTESQRRAISIEMGIKNSGLSLGLVFNFWGGWGEPALVAAWWGLWHLLVGFLLAKWWGRKAPQ